MAVSAIPARSINESYVPDSSPGAVIESGTFGKLPLPPTFVARSLASDQFLKPSDSGPNNAYRSPKLRHVTASFAGFVITVMPSSPISSST